MYLVARQADDGNGFRWHLLGGGSRVGRLSVAKKLVGGNSLRCRIGQLSDSVNNFSRVSPSTYVSCATGHLLQGAYFHPSKCWPKVRCGLTGDGLQRTGDP